ncbi:YdaU family protein [Roseovarius nitratireducens]|uniref:YdaU family protein n=1 Tax=Roseovarius nitratireducens TaxID=2044597 RepID=UPI000CE22A98|nr:DUF1376 domain-containing protein [Roseovarius nitratireducens]
MSKAPAMPMYWDAYLADTTHLTTEEHGAYLLLLGAMWRRNGRVPDDDKDNARILGLTPSKWRKVKARFCDTISGFQVENGMITQEKLQKTWENTQEKIEKNRTNGAKGGRPKSNKNNNKAKANGSVSDNPTETKLAPGAMSPDDDTTKPFDEIAECVSAYNEIAREAGWPEVRVLSKARRSELSQRLKECGGIEGWRHALAKARASPHCCGMNDRGWTANFDFLVRQSSFTKLMEGNYDYRPSQGGSPKGTQPERTERHRRVVAAAARGTTSQDWG